MASKQTVVYTTNSGKKMKIKLSAASVAAQPTAPATSGFDIPLFAKVGGGRKGYGVHARYANLYKVNGTQPNLYITRDKLAICTQADAATLEAAGNVTVGGVTWQISSITQESSR
jgi:hypothetical protein